MEQEEILKRAIKRAVKGGWSWKGFNKFTKVTIEDNGDDVYAYLHQDTGLYLPAPINNIIFSHDFAKAFWGDKLSSSHDCVDEQSCCLSGIPLWQFHLQQMVLEKNPLKYLEKFL